MDTSKIDLTLISGGSVGKKRGSRKAKPVSKPTAADSLSKKRKRKLSAKEIDEALAAPREVKEEEGEKSKPVLAGHAKQALKPQAKKRRKRKQLWSKPGVKIMRKVKV